MPYISAVNKGLSGTVPTSSQNPLLLAPRVLCYQHLAFYVHGEVTQGTSVRLRMES